MAILDHLRQRTTAAALRGVCWFSALKNKKLVDGDVYWTEIFGGPLRGMLFAMPRLERLAFPFGTYEPHVVRILNQQVAAGQVAYDLGANAGYLTMILASLVGKKGQVFSFEPDAKSFKALKANIKQNNLAQVTAVPKAVSSETGTVTFASYDYSLIGHIIHDNTSDDARLVEVPTICLDDFIFREQHPAPDFIKIDVEGSEELVLRGARRMLAEIRPLILAEIRSGWMWENVLEIMEIHRYQYEFVSGKGEFEKDLVGDVLFTPE